MSRAVAPARSSSALPPSRSNATPAAAPAAGAEPVTRDSFAAGKPSSSRAATPAATPVALPTIALGHAPGDSPRVDLPDPSLMTEQQQDTEYQYDLVHCDGPLFDGGPKASDIHQGMAGDCYYLSSLAAIAQSEPKAFHHLIYSNHDGTFTVIFHQRDEKTGQFKAVPVHVDSDLYATTYAGPPKEQQLTYDSPQPSEWGDHVQTQSLWGPLLEKAFAQLNGNSFENIGEGGWPADAMEALLGRASQSVSTSDTSQDKVWSFIQFAVDTHSPICASTHCEPEKQDQYTNTGIVGAHAYTVMGYEQHGQDRYVVLRNPWGQTEPAGNGADDGVFKLPLADFMKYYDQLDASPRHPKA